MARNIFRLEAKGSQVLSNKPVGSRIELINYTVPAGKVAKITINHLRVLGSNPYYGAWVVVPGLTMPKANVGVSRVYKIAVGQVVNSTAHFNGGSNTVISNQSFIDNNDGGLVTFHGLTNGGAEVNVSDTQMVWTSGDAVSPVSMSNVVIATAGESIAAGVVTMVTASSNVGIYFSGSLLIIEDDV